VPRKDILHDVVKRALIKDGWIITHDPLHIEFGGLDFYVDLGAEELIGAEKNGRQIAVEVKSFIIFVFFIVDYEKNKTLRYRLSVSFTWLLDSL
jgi:hypothetical protein